MLSMPKVSFYVLMRKSIRQSDTNVNCVNINEKYNHNIEEFFQRES